MASRETAVTGRDTVDIYTDGACSGNPGPGGWGAILRYGGECGAGPGRHQHFVEYECGSLD